jgi:hypothetical protein
LSPFVGYPLVEEAMMKHPQSPVLSIYSGQNCIGFILKRSKAGFEAFNQNDISLGTFHTDQEAADAVSLAAKEVV